MLFDTFVIWYFIWYFLTRFIIAFVLTEQLMSINLQFNYSNSDHMLFTYEFHLTAAMEWWRHDRKSISDKINLNKSVNN